MECGDEDERHEKYRDAEEWEIERFAGQCAEDDHNARGDIGKPTEKMARHGMWGPECRHTEHNDKIANGENATEQKGDERYKEEGQLRVAKNWSATGQECAIG